MFKLVVVFTNDGKCCFDIARKGEESERMWDVMFWHHTKRAMASMPREKMEILTKHLKKARIEFFVNPHGHLFDIHMNLPFSIEEKMILANDKIENCILDQEASMLRCRFFLQEKENDE